MQAIEFETDIRGRVIELPDGLTALSDKHVKIILLFNDAAVKDPKRKRAFRAVRLRTKDFKFDRDEIYDG